MATTINPNALEIGRLFFVLSSAMGISAALLFSGAFLPVQPLLEFLSVVFSITAFWAGIQDINLNHTDKNEIEFLAIVYFVIAISVLVFVIIAVVDTNFLPEHHITPEDVPYGIGLAIALIVLAATDLIWNHL